MNHYRHDITGLRAVAVLAVVFAHCAPSLVPGGVLGVDVFFVISGFVITRSIGTRARDTGALRFLAQFYARRFSRLGPALLLNVAVVSIVFCLFQSFPKEGLTTGVASLFGVSNIYLAYKGLDYFAQSAQLNPFTQTWSLGVEERFYLIYPLYAFVFLFSSRGRLTRWFAPVTVGVLTLSLIGYFFEYSDNAVLAFYLAPFRFFELAFGCLLARLPARFGETSELSPFVLPVAFVVLLGSFIIGAASTPVELTLCVVASGLLVVFGGGPTPLGRLLESGPAQYVGRLSYSLYLWHWPVLAIARLTVGVTPQLAPFELTAMFGLAHLSRRFVECRWIDRPLALNPARSFALGAGAIGALTLVLLLLAYPLEGRLFVGEKAPLRARGSGSMTGSFKSSAGGTWNGDKCVLASTIDVGRPFNLADCTIGAPGAARRVLVIGNSFAVAFLRGVTPIAHDPRYRVSLIASYGAAAVPGVSVQPAFRTMSADYWTRIIPAAFAKLEPGDVVLLVTDLTFLESGDKSPYAVRDTTAFLRGLAKLSADLHERGATLAVLWGVPPLALANCTPEQAMPQWFASGATACKFYTRPAARARMARLGADLIRLEDEGAIRLVDVFDALCPGETCGFFAPDGTTLFRDEYGHVSEEGADRSASLIVGQLLGSGTAFRSRRAVDVEGTPATLTAIHLGARSNN
ncbi:MAG: acyltransferase family protein [Croceibacterium sp.]